MPSIQRWVAPPLTPVLEYESVNPHLFSNMSLSMSKSCLAHPRYPPPPQLPTPPAPCFQCPLFSIVMSYADGAIRLRAGKCCCAAITIGVQYNIWLQYV